MSKSFFYLVQASLILLPLTYAPAHADQGNSEDISQYMCKDVMRMSGEDRGVALGVLHGFVMGKKGVTTMVSDDAHKLSSDFTEYCLDNPQAKALESFEKLAQ